MRAVHWLRADLRLDDHRALREAARRASELACVFVLDEGLLASERTGAPRVRFLLEGLARLGEDLAARGQRLVLRRGDPVREISRVLEATRAELLVFSRCESPYARRRDARVLREAARLGVRVQTFKDRVAFEAAEVRKRDGTAFSVYTPYRSAWRLRWSEGGEEPQPAPRRLPPPIEGLASEPLPGAADLGFGGDDTRIPAAGEAAARRRLRAFLAGAVAGYAKGRDVPGEDGTSRLSPYLRFGMLSPRRALAAAFERAREGAGRASVQKWIDELVWREFYAAALEGHPHLRTRALRPAFDAVRWNDDPAALAAWQRGLTGYPIVDAGMRQLAATGWMHNRVRMIAASFLSKDLLLDWRLGEETFFRLLVDGDPASNAGGWQWAASTGTDAQPWFRIFNPVLQGRRVDPAGEYVRRFVPELRAVPDSHVHDPWNAPQPPRGYPPPIVDHAERRAEALRRYRAAAQGSARRAGDPPGS